MVRSSPIQDPSLSHLEILRSSPAIRDRAADIPNLWERLGPSQASFFLPALPPKSDGLQESQILSG